MQEFYRIREVRAWQLSVVVAVLVVVAFIGGYAASLWHADYTMSDTQAWVFCNKVK